MQNEKRVTPCQSVISIKMMIADHQRGNSIILTPKGRSSLSSGLHQVWPADDMELDFTQWNKGIKPCLVNKGILTFDQVSLVNQPVHKPLVRGKSTLERAFFNTTPDRHPMRGTPGPILAARERFSTSQLNMVKSGVIYLFVL